MSYCATCRKPRQHRNPGPPIADWRCCESLPIMPPTTQAARPRRALRWPTLRERSTFRRALHCASSDRWRWPDLRVVASTVDTCRGRNSYALPAAWQPPPHSPASPMLRCWRSPHLRVSRRTWPRPPTAVMPFTWRVIQVHTPSATSVGSASASPAEPQRWALRLPAKSSLTELQCG